MRNFYNGVGEDSTATVLAWLAAHRQLEMADLYIINTAPNYYGQPMGKTFLLTDYPSPLQWSWKGSFVPAVISRGEVESKIGLESQSLDITWSPRDADILASISDTLGDRRLTALQGFGAGCFDNAIVEVWRCVMPTAGDCDTLGACLLFAGRIGDITPDRLKVAMSVVSRLDALNAQLPTNLIEPTNIYTQYSTGRLLPTTPQYFEVQEGSTRNTLQAIATMWSGVDVPDGAYDDGYIVLQTGAQAGTYRSIRKQVTVSSGVFVFYLYEDLPLLATPGAYAQAADRFQAFIPPSLDQVSSKDAYAGFPYVPSPVNSTVIVG
jgi:hypothetical protein